MPVSWWPSLSGRVTAESSLFLGLILLPMMIMGLASGGGGGTEQCLNPPAGNPNLCHIYTWKPFPQDTGFTPKTGLFNNDTSYYFNINNTLASPGVSFEICGQIIKSSTGNATLTLQYYQGSGVWGDFDGGGLGAGSLGLDWQGFSIPVTECSSILGGAPTIGIFSVANPQCNTFGQGDTNGCTVRIAGNEPLTNCGCASDSAQIAQLNVVFFYGTLSNPIVCVIQTKSATQFVDACSRIFSTGVGPNVALAWTATNETSAVEGVWKTGTVNCSIPINGLSCTNTVTFSPAFKAGSIVTVEFSQNPLLSGGVLSLQTTYPVLT